MDLFSEGMIEVEELDQEDKKALHPLEEVGTSIVLEQVVAIIWHSHANVSAHDDVKVVG